MSSSMTWSMGIEGVSACLFKWILSLHMASLSVLAIYAEQTGMRKRKSKQDEEKDEYNY